MGLYAKANMASTSECQYGLFENFSVGCCCQAAFFYPCTYAYTINQKAGEPCPAAGAFLAAMCVGNCLICFTAKKLKPDEPTMNVVLKGIYCGPCYVGQQVFEPEAGGIEDLRDQNRRRQSGPSCGCDLREDLG